MHLCIHGWFYQIWSQVFINYLSFDQPNVIPIFYSRDQSLLAFNLIHFSIKSMQIISGLSIFGRHQNKVKCNYAVIMMIVYISATVVLCSITCVVTHIIRMCVITLYDCIYGCSASTAVTLIKVQNTQCLCKMKQLHDLSRSTSIFLVNTHSCQTYSQSVHCSLDTRQNITRQIRSTSYSLNLSSNLASNPITLCITTVAICM